MNVLSLCLECVEQFGTNHLGRVRAEEQYPHVTVTTPFEHGRQNRAACMADIDVRNSIWRHVIPGEHVLPLFIENVGIELLQLALAGSICIRVTLVLKMNNCRRWLIQNTQSMRTNFHR